MERWKGSDGRTTSRARTHAKMLTAWVNNICNGLIGSEEAVGRVGRCKSSGSGVQAEASWARCEASPRALESAHSGDEGRQSGWTTRCARARSPTYPKTTSRSQQQPTRTPSPCIAITTICELASAPAQNTMHARAVRARPPLQSRLKI